MEGGRAKNRGVIFIEGGNLMKMVDCVWPETNDHEAEMTECSRCSCTSGESGLVVKSVRRDACMLSK